jgi:hypothetical protein
MVVEVPTGHVDAKGHRHHVAVTPGQYAAPLREALEKYVGCEVTPQGD